MEYLSVFITIGLFLKVFGSCPQNSPNPKVTSCDGTTKNGTQVYIDFEKINKPCNCIAIPAFDGDLFVRADVQVSSCDAFVRVTNTIFNCQKNIESSVFKVNKTHPVTVEADYKSDSSRTRFYHCLLFNENVGGNGHVSVKCGEITPSTYKTTTKSITTGGSSTEMLPITTKTEDDTANTIVGLTAGGGLVFVAMSIIIVVIFLSRHRRRNKSENKIPKETLTIYTEHTNNGYDYEHNLPDNLLYYSSQPADEVGYSTVEEQKPSPDPSMKDSDHTPNIYDTPVKREMINDRDTKQKQPVYATPKKNQSNPVDSTGGDMYAQVNKANKNRKNSPVRKQNQDGPVYMEVDHSRDSQTENSPYTNYYTSETVAYAEVKTK